MTTQGFEWLTTKELARRLRLSQGDVPLLYRRRGFPRSAMQWRAGLLLWHFPTVDAWRAERATVVSRRG
jgi:hypothetical protein